MTPKLPPGEGHRDLAGLEPAEGEPFGQYLSRQRELRGITLAQIADQTRIGVSNLKALEEDDRSRLPARVFVLGHIRAYAQAIGLNPDEAALRYDEEQQKQAPREEPVTPRYRHPALGERTDRRSSGRLLVALAVAAVVLGAVAWLLLRHP
jgi:cytoskeletal protein RodZ